MKRVATILFEFLFIGAVVVAGVGAVESRLHPIVGGFLLAASVWLVFRVIALGSNYIWPPEEEEEEEE